MTKRRTTRSLHDIHPDKEKSADTAAAGGPCRPAPPKIISSFRSPPAAAAITQPRPNATANRRRALPRERETWSRSARTSCRSGTPSRRHDQRAGRPPARRPRSGPAGPTSRRCRSRSTTRRSRRRHAPPVRDDARRAAAGASMEAGDHRGGLPGAVGLFPSRGDKYQTACTSEIGELADGDAKTRGIAIGRRGGPSDGLRCAPMTVASVWRLRRSSRARAPGAVPRREPGQPRPVPSVRPFTLTQRATSSGPSRRRRWPASVYARDFDEVKAHGGAASTSRTVAQLDLARFHTEPPARRAVPQPAPLRDRSMPLADNAPAAARCLSVAARRLRRSAASNAKYHYGFWRPQSAIPLGRRPTAIRPPWPTRLGRRWCRRPTTPSTRPRTVA